VERLLGITVPPAEIVRVLEALEFTVEVGETLRVTAPEHRLDCQAPADLIEEVARVYGYGRIAETQLADRLPPQRGNPGLEMEEWARDVLVGCGLQEVVTYSLTTPARHAALTPGSAEVVSPCDAFVALANPIGPDRTVLRRSLLATTLEVVPSNLHLRGRVALFEVGKVFLPRPGLELPSEPARLCVVMSGRRYDRHWLGEAGPALDFFDVKGVVETLLARWHIRGAAYVACEHPTLQPGRRAALVLEGTEIGVMGELHPLVREAFDLPDCRVAVAELDLEALIAHIPSTWLVRPVSAYPAILQDLAVVVDVSVPAAQVADLIAETGGSLLHQVTLFDDYRAESVPPGKKSLAFSLSFQAPDKTLSDDQVAKHVKRIVTRLSKEVGAELRS
jgi:phenylalanyl-tRNA synthetase beta chain